MPKYRIAEPPLMRQMIVIKDGDDDDDKDGDDKNKSLISVFVN